MTQTSRSEMTSSDWFGVGVRLFSLYIFYEAFDNLLYFVDLRSGFSSADYQFQGADPNAYLMYFMGKSLAGLLLFLFAGSITNWAYFPNSRFATDDGENEVADNLQNESDIRGD